MTDEYLHVKEAARLAGCGTQTTPLIDERLRRIEQKLDQLFVLQEKLLALSQPRSLATLASKHTRR